MPGKSAAPKKAAPRRSAMPKQPMDEKSMLADFFHDELKDIYWAEKHLLKTLPKMQKAATSQELKDAFGEHLEVTQTHVERLEQVFELLGHKAQAKKCDAMAGITEEGAGIIEETEKGTSTRDVGLILAAQKVEHYEIATYGGLAQLAKTLGYTEIKELLGTTLAEEKEADETLSQIAEAHVNIDASEEDEDGEKKEDSEEDNDDSSSDDNEDDDDTSDEK
ncbi:MAG: ferritin-like domain-containing protein, partial [Pedobacter sp.]